MPTLKTFREQLRSKDFVVTAGLRLNALSTIADIGAAVDILKAHVDAIQLGDSQSGGHISPLVVAQEAINRGLDPVVHMSARDRNKLALQSDLLGAAAIGVSSLVLVRGRKLPAETNAKIKDVFDSRVAELINLAHIVGEASTDSTEGFLIGSLLTLFRPDPEWRADKPLEKVQAGAKFLQSQPCLNLRLARTYMDVLVRERVTRNASVLVEVPICTSLESARLLKENRPNAALPDSLVDRLAGSSNPVDEGIRISAEIVTGLQEIPGVAGVNITYDRDPIDVLNLMDAIRGQ